MSAGPAEARRRGTGGLAVAALVGAAFMGSVIVSPLYPLYQRRFGFTELTLTLVYATYTVGNLAALLLLGQLSDRLGRKRVSLPGLGVAAAAAVVFLLAQGTAWLFAGRLLTGLAVGVLSGTATAWLVERYGPERRAEATVVSATANLLGIAAGPAVGGVLAEVAPDPLQLPLAAYLVVLVVVAVGVVRTPDPRSANPPPLRELRLRPEIGVPAPTLPAFVAPATAAFVSFALGGLYFALIPGIVRRDLHIGNVAVGGLVVTVVGLCAALTVVVGRRLRPVVAMRAAMVLLLPAVALVPIAQAARSLPLLLGAAVLAGVTNALGYRGSLQVVNDIAGDEHRGQVTSSYFVACFTGNSVPVIGIGVLGLVTGPFVAGVVFAATLAVLGLAALLVSFRRAGASPSSPTGTPDRS